MKSHLDRTVKRPTRIAAIAALTATMFAGSALGQPGQAPPQTKQVAAYIGDLGNPNPRVRERAADMLGIIGLDVKVMRSQKAESAEKHLSNSREIFLKLLEKVRSFPKDVETQCVANRDYEALELAVVEHLLGG